MDRHIVELEDNFQPDKKTVDKDIDSKIKELLKFQHNMIVKLNKVIEKLDKMVYTA